MDRKILALLLCFLGVGVVIASAAVDRIVAIVNDEVITEKDLESFLAVMFLQSRDEYKDKAEFEQGMRAYRPEAIERMIEDRLVAQEAKRQRLSVPEGMVAQRIEEMKAKFNSPDEFAAALAVEGLTINDVKNKLTEQVLMRRAIEENVRNKVSVSPTEITAYYQGHQPEIRMPQLAEVDSIYIPFLNSATEAKAKSREAWEELKKGDDFSVVAAKYSYAASLGKVAKGQLRPDIEKVIFGLKTGEFSSPVETEKGYY
ncbi:MAG: SurA N-terminal domain-containing protein, partial [Candidatus Omnitrophota bacterium]